MKQSFKLIESAHYPILLEQEFANAKKRIIVAAMLVGVDTTTEPLFTLIRKALARGIAVHIAADVYIRFPLADEPKSLRQYRDVKKQLAKTLSVLDDLTKRGATISMIGSLKGNPYAGRFHQKFTIIDDTVYFGGGINFNGPSFQLTDYHFVRTDHALAENLIAQLIAIRDKGIISDSSQQITEDTTLHIDGGTPGASVIYERAIALARAAENITYVSQWAPSGSLAKSLHEKNTVCYFNRPSQMYGPGLIGQLIDQLRYRTRNSYHDVPYIHAKYILYEMKNGKRIGLSGSHNFSERGVRYGTQELAVESENKTLYELLERFTHKHIA